MQIQLVTQRVGLSGVMSPGQDPRVVAVNTPGSLQSALVLDIKAGDRGREGGRRWDGMGCK